ncbi:MAG: rod shape-determining protein MreC [bacterium]
MKRTLHNRFSIGALGNSFFLFLLFVLLVVVLLWRSFFTGIFWRVSTPLLQTGKVVLAPVDFVLGGFSAKAALYRENARLLTELASSTAHAADREVLLQENADLKARLGRPSAQGSGTEQHIVLGGILLAPPGVPYDTLLIDAGSAQGLVVGDLVSAGGAMLIGSISEVHQATATVLLYSAPGQNHHVLLLSGGASTTNAKTVPLDLEGQGAGSLRAEVPAGTLVKVGDAVVTPGVQNGFVGTVSKVEKKDSESFETFYVTLPVNPLELRFVEVWKQKP